MGQRVVSWSSYHDLVTAGHVGATMLVGNEAIYYHACVDCSLTGRIYRLLDVSNTEVR